MYLGVDDLELMFDFNFYVITAENPVGFIVRVQVTALADVARRTL